jgi:hypothetical protein
MAGQPTTAAADISSYTCTIKKNCLFILSKHYTNRFLMDKSIAWPGRIEAAVFISIVYFNLTHQLNRERVQLFLFKHIFIEKKNTVY